MLLTKAGCDVQELTHENITTLTVYNPPDNADKIGELAKAALGQAFNE